MGGVLGGVMVGVVFAFWGRGKSFVRKDIVGLNLFIARGGLVMS